MTPTISVRDADGQPLAGDAANLTLYVIVDGVSTPYSGTITETDAGEYVVTVDREGLLQRITGTTSTEGGIVVPSSWDNRFQNSPLPTPASADNYAVYGVEYGLDGNVAAGEGDVTVRVVDCDPSCLYTASDGSVRHVIGTEFETDANGQWSFNIAKSAVATRKEIALSFEYASGNPTKVIKLAWMDETVANDNDQIAFAAWKPRIRSGTG